MILINSRAKKISKALLADKIVAIETDTILGLSCQVKPVVIDKLIHLKGRDPTRSFIIISSSIDHLYDLIDISKMTDVMVETLNKVHERPTTFIVPAKESYLNRHQDHDTIAVRMVRTGAIHDVCLMLRAPIISTSVNKTGNKPALTLLEAIRCFPDSVEYIGPYEISQSSVPSRIISLENGRIVRV